MPRNECKPLLDACGPDIYGRNAFCLLGADADQPGRRIKRQEKELQAAIEIDDLADEYCKTLRPDPLPTREELSQAGRQLSDPQQRFICEFFWFWPLEWGKSATDEALGLLKSGNVKEAQRRWTQIAEDGGKASLAARHNLAVLGHWRALEREQKILASTDTGKVTREQRQKIVSYWSFAFKYWETLCTDESFWSMQADRIRGLNDPRLTTGFLRRFAQSLPIAFDNINADLAVAYCDREMYASAKDHVKIMKATNAGSDDVDASLQRVTKPLQRRIAQAIETATSQLVHNKEEGKQRCIELFETVRDILNVLQTLLGKESPEYTDTCDHVAETMGECIFHYGRETEDWDRCLPLLEHTAGLALDEAIQSRLQNWIAQIKEKHAEEEKVEELKKAVTADYVYDVTIVSREKEGLRASVPGVCTCCLGPPDGEQAVSHEWEETRGLKRYKRSVSFGFPICETCRNHQSEYSKKRTFLVLLAAGISTVIAFFVAGVIPKPEWSLFVVGGGFLTVVLLFLLGTVIRLSVLPEQHACRGQAVEMRDASGGRAVFRFHNPIYAEAFADANDVTVRRHHEYKPTRGSFILVLPNAVLLVVAAIVLGGIGQSIIYSALDDGDRSSRNPPRTSVSRPPRTDSPSRRSTPKDRQTRTPSPEPRTYTPPKRYVPTDRYTDSPSLKPPIYVPPQRYVPTRIDTGLSKKIDSGRARVRTLETEITRMDSEIKPLSASLDIYRREVDGYNSQVRRGVRVNDTLHQRAVDRHNQLVQQIKSLAAQRELKFDEYQREIESVNNLVGRYNRGER